MFEIEDILVNQMIGNNKIVMYDEMKRVKNRKIIAFKGKHVGLDCKYGFSSSLVGADLDLRILFSDDIISD